jgi:Zn-finger nucleic acid-binding protein
MNCPSCADTALLLSERQGVEIDYCPRCRGVWLDRGELDKLIERSKAYSSPAYPANAERRDHDNGYKRKHPAKSWLGEIFD